MKTIRVGPGLSLSSGPRGISIGLLAKRPPPSRVRETKLYTQALTVAGIIPTAAEITTAIQAAYTTAATTPRQGDTINLTVSGVCKLRTTVTTTGTASGLYVVTFTVGSTTYYGNQVQTGLY